MSTDNFPNIRPKDFNIRDCIIHSLIEGTIEKRKDKNYILNMIDYLAKYREENGEDIIIDILFIKYLKKCQVQLPPNNITSQYHIALSCFARNYSILGDIESNAEKVKNGEKITVRDVELSNFFSYKILKYFSNDYLIIKDKIGKPIPLTQPNNILDSIKNRKIVNFDVFYQPISKQLIQDIYNEFMKDPYQYLPIGFWSLVAEYEIITEFTINVGNNPYLLNAGACLSYEHRRINVKYDIEKIQLPKEINVHVYKLICYQLSLRKLLEYPSESIEIRNLCSLIYILYLNETSLKSLANYSNLMDFRSYIILILTLSNYINFEIPDSIIKSISEYYHSNKINDFLFVKCFFLLIKSKKNIESLIPPDFLYVTPQSLYNKMNFSKLEINAAFYGIVKKCMANAKLVTSKEMILNNEDMKRFLDSLVRFADIKTRRMIIIEFQKDLSHPEHFIDILSYYIDECEYSKAIDALEKVNPNEQILKALKSQSMIKKIKTLLNRINQLNCTYETLAKFDLQSVFDNNEKYDLFFKDSLHEIRFKVSRSSILNDSIKIFSQNSMENKKIRVNYLNETGVDAGGLTRDWLTTLSEAIKNEEIFIPTPNGDSLTFNINYKNKDVLFFIGQLIAVAFSNKQNLNLQLSSFVWKKMLNHQIELEDMKDYDIEIYNSLEWILNNDVTNCSLTFVNSDDVELIEGGQNIEVNNENKIEYINLMLEDKFSKNFTAEIENLSSGFRAVIDKRRIDLLYSSNEIRQFINGNEIIDINDWKKNTEYSYKYEKHYKMFFTVISEWTVYKQKKLLKFVTGSSQVPIDGFKDYKNRGGTFKLQFIDYEKNRLPSAHTCSNHLDIPCYQTCEEFDKALSYAIECDEFGFN